MFDVERKQEASLASHSSPCYHSYDKKTLTFKAGESRVFLLPVSFAGEVNKIRVSYRFEDENPSKRRLPSPGEDDRMVDSDQVLTSNILSEPN